MKTGRTILLVEDDAATRKGLYDLLTAAGYRVVEAADFPEGRRALLSTRPDLVLTDVRLGGFNGLQLLTLSPTPIPAIVVTGFDDPVLEAEARTLGGVFLVKPVAPRDLLQLIEQKLPRAEPAPDRRTARVVMRDRPILWLPAQNRSRGDI